MNGSGEQGGFCCEMMQGNVTNMCDQHPDRYDCPDMLVDRVRGGFGLMIRSDAGGGVIEIRYCPWCGSNLPPIGEIEIR